MLTGDLSTMSLADLLQWVDANRSRALITVRTPEGGGMWMKCAERMVVAAAAPEARGRLATDGRPDAPGPGLIAVTREHLLDLFLTSRGTFELEQPPPRELPGPSVSLELSVQFLVMEGLRLLDEWPRLFETYPREEARVAATDAQAERLGPIDAAIRELAQRAPALGEARLELGMSRPALLRHVDHLRARGLVEVEGIPHGPDLEGSLIDQARLLLEQGQYAEAAYVFRSLLAANPTDVRIRNLLREAERLRLESLYGRFPPTAVVTRAAGGSGRRLEGADIAVLDCLARPRPVAVLVLASPLRELETLTALERLSARGMVTIESAD